MVKDENGTEHTSSKTVLSVEVGNGNLNDRQNNATSSENGGETLPKNVEENGVENVIVESVKAEDLRTSKKRKFSNDDITLNCEPSVSNAKVGKLQASEGDAKTMTECRTPNKKKNRCIVCGKKVGLIGFTCRCGNLFCGIHRYTDKHFCTFDYRKLGAEEIRRNNPVVICEKIRKI